MSIKVAVASSDGKFINQHFGMATKFLIFVIKSENEFEFLEVRETSPFCSSYREHDEDGLTSTVDLLSDCKAVMVSQIGPGAAGNLIDAGIRPIVYPDFIEKGLMELSQNLDHLDSSI